MCVHRVFVALAVMSVLAGAGATGCAKKKPVAATPPPPAAPAAPAKPATPPPPPPPPPPAPTPPSAPLTEEEIFSQKTLEQLNAEKPLTDVFFDYDSDALTDQSRSGLQKDAEWMKKFTTTKVTVEADTWMGQ